MSEMLATSSAKSIEEIRSFISRQKEEKGIELPKKDVLESCWRKNPDGAGFMFNDCNKVVIMKGFMTCLLYTSLWKNLVLVKTT